MKIAVMTYWGYNDNYGQLMQAYALSTYLRSMGHEPRLIKYDHMHDVSLKRSLISRIYSMAHKPTQLYKGLLNRVSHIFAKPTYSNCPCATSFDAFKQTNLNWTQDYPTYQSLVDNPPQDDVYICGSDMIWAESAFDPDPFFLNFGHPQKRIAYAPSFGRNSITSPYAKYIKALLRPFDAISVREDSGVQICNSLGRSDAICVPDPTLLLSKEDYERIEEPYDIPSPYVFAYVLGEECQKIMPQIIKEANGKNLRVVYRSAQGGKDDGLEQTYPTPSQWLSLIKKADYIVTNSFHGVIFSIIYRKNFVYIPSKGKMSSTNERIYSILNMLNIPGRIYSDGKFFIDSVTYDQGFENLLSQSISKGKSFLHENLI